MTARRPRRPRRAFSLLEVLVASVILGGALVVILGSISSSLSAGTRAERLDAAHAIAGNRLRLAAAGAAGTLPAEGDEELSGVTYR
ncbi:MAG: prepilin-type N-terminal cleavage/methylation domain-containing protein, partial [Planctomycetota bacterium]